MSPTRFTALSPPRGWLDTLSGDFGSCIGASVDTHRPPPPPAATARAAFAASKRAFFAAARKAAAEGAFSPFSFPDVSPAPFPFFDFNAAAAAAAAAVVFARFAAGAAARFPAMFGYTTCDYLIRENVFLTLVRHKQANFSNKEKS
jgi:hypothetical protein